MTDDSTLQGLIGRFQQFGGATAIIVGDQARPAAISFDELSNAALRLADDLAGRGVIKGAPIAISGPNSPDWVRCFWGIIAAGAVAVPLDPGANDEELARFIERAGCRLAFVPSSRIESLRQWLPNCDMRQLGRAPQVPTHPAPKLPTVNGGDVAVIVFTSGTTGTPKAVPLSHRNLLSNVEALLAEGIVAPGDSAMLPLPLHHIYPLTVGMLTPLAAGTAIVLTENLSGPQFVSALKSSAATILVGVPRLYAALAAGITAHLPRPVTAALAVSGWLRRNVGVDLGSALFRGVRAQFGPALRLLVCGGAALDRDVEERLLDLGWQVLTGYGLSETSPILTFNRRDATLVGSAGQPLPDTQIRISAPDAGGVGEIEARGPSVFTGYLGDDAASQAAFTSDGWFRTGDLGRLDGQGYLHIVARRNETIVLSSGKKVFPEDIEAVYASIAYVKEAAILARDGNLVALVVPDFDALRAHGATRLVDVIRDALDNRAATLPGHFRLGGYAIVREPLPRTQIGKVRRHLLPDLYARASAARPPAQSPVLDATDRGLLSDPVAASVWDWLQTRYPEQAMSLDTSPQLDLGIDSLGWIEVTLALQRSLRIEMNDAAIARIVTLRDLLREAAAAARSEVSATESRAVALPPPSDGPFVAALHYLFYIMIRCLMRLAYGVRSEGVDRLPDEPFILCPNHTSFLDPFAVATALPYRRVRRLRWGGWTGQLFGTPVRRTFSRIVHVLPIDPDRAAASSLALATGVLTAGYGLVWFAEGERSWDGSPTRFRPGIGVLAERTHVPVVPVCIEGAFAAWPRGRTWPRFGRISVRFGDPLKPDVILGTAHGADRHQNIADRVRDTVQRLSRREAA